MKWILVLVFLLAPSAGHLAAKEIHVFLGADTITSLKRPTKQDLKHLKEALSYVASATELPMTISEYTGSDLTYEKTIEWIDTTVTHPDDIILFYYTGHGGRIKQMQTPWPCVYYPAKKEVIDSNFFLARLASKPHALCIFLTDCCNEFVDVSRHLDVYEFDKLQQQHVTSQSKLAIQQLFVNTKGLIIASSAEPGHRSVCTKEGSAFTTAFLISLDNELKQSAPNWDHVLNKTRLLCQKWRHSQIPIFQVQIEH